MRRSLFAFVLATLAICVVTSTARAQQQNPLMGTWKTNPARSKSVLGPPALTQTVKYEASGPNGVKYTSDRVSSTGVKTHVEFTANFDGKTYPYKSSGTDVTRDGIAIKKIEPHTYQVFYKLRGETTQINFWIVSKDGKTLTTVSTGITTDTSGKPVDEPVYVRLAVAEKQ
jgi:hypothetical protein